MRPVLLVLALIASLATAGLVHSPSARACDIQTDPRCVGVVTAGGGAPAATPHPVRRGGGAGPSKPDPCSRYPGGYHRDCAGSTGAQCLSLYDQYFGSMPLASFDDFVAKNGCPTLAAAGPPPPSPAVLAQRAAASFRLPDPSGHRSPSEDTLVSGYSATYVNLWTYFWTDPATWRPLTATARAGANYATVTATPSELTFDPGDGSPTHACPGPGRPWTDADADNKPAAGACGVEYTRITGPGYDHPLTSTQTITWDLTWTGSGNTRGRLTQKHTSGTGRLNVLQVQTVNR